MNIPNDKKRWKVLKSEYLFTEPWLTVRCDAVQLPNGHLIPSYYVTEYPDWVNMIAVTREKRFVFVRQYRHGIGGVHFELCAGVCEKEDASPLISAQRELLEETGYGNGVWEEYMRLSPNASTVSNITHCFLARDVEKIGEPHPEDSEDLSVHLFSFGEVKQMLENNEIIQSLMAASLWKFVAENMKNEQYL
jgi:8-oxo-dGTP pyrophosphatase MutT (NUDIX family)